MQKEFRGNFFNNDRRAVITGTGAYAPTGVMTNHDLEKIVDTSDEWITTRTGIKERHIVEAGKETAASIGTEAAKRALEAANCPADEIDYIVCSTITPEVQYPATACFIQEGIGNTHACAFDITATCSGFVYANNIAASFISAGQAKKVLVVGTETMSTSMNWQDRNTCVLFGDGAGAVVLELEENSERGLIYNNVHADGRQWETIVCPGPGSRFPIADVLSGKHKRVYTELNGRETYKQAVSTIVDTITNSLEQTELAVEDIKMMIPHQMNARIIEAVMKRVDFKDEQVFINIDRYGNTSSASIPIALDEAVRDGKLQKDDLVLLIAFGSGFTWGSNLFKM